MKFWLLQQIKIQNQMSLTAQARQLLEWILYLFWTSFQVCRRHLNILCRSVRPQALTCCEWVALSARLAVNESGRHSSDWRFGFLLRSCPLRIGVPNLRCNGTTLCCLRSRLERTHSHHFCRRCKRLRMFISCAERNCRHYKFRFLVPHFYSLLPAILWIWM